jgi:hypothetical protein
LSNDVWIGLVMNLVAGVAGVPSMGRRFNGAGDAPSKIDEAKRFRRVFLICARKFQFIATTRWFAGHVQMERADRGGCF